MNLYLHLLGSFAVIAMNPEGNDGIHCALDELTQSGNIAALIEK